MRRFALVAVVVGVGVAWATVKKGSDPYLTPAFADGRHQGMSYAHAWRDAEARGYGSAASAESLRILQSLGVNWISITPFGFQRTPRDTAIRWGGSRLSETDERLRAVTRQAHALGIRVMLKPHIWLRPPAWVGQIAHDSGADWAAWFASYREFILRYARLAEEAGIEALCIGNEIEKTTTREREWRALIGDIRSAYRGPITYGAGFSEVYGVPFWDALDFIGVSAYFSLSDASSPSRAELVTGWQPHLAKLEALAARWNRTIVFTELGYRSADHGAQSPWRVDRQAAVNLTLQADAYAAFFEAVWPQPWFGGVYWWKWFSFPGDGGPDDNDFTPRNKPAEAVLQRHYALARELTTSARGDRRDRHDATASQPTGSSTSR